MSRLTRLVRLNIVVSVYAATVVTLLLAVRIVEVWSA